MIGNGSPTRIDMFPPESVTTAAGSHRDDSSVTSERELPFATLPIETCIYRGEGNANLVIALPHEQKVIRFRKSLPGEVSPDGGTTRARREVEFVREVASSFLGSYVLSPEILRYSMKDVAKLSEAIRSLRPEKRRHKDIAEEYATKFPDYTFLPPKLLRDRVSLQGTPTFCVEIKPKQAFMRKADRRFQKCPFCLTQYYKLKKKSIVSRSLYCPLDLFSGDEGRMKTALKGLLRSPQNNLKIFKDGTIVYDQDSSLNDLEQVLAEWFRNATPHSKESDENAFCTLVRETLLRSFPQDVQNSNAHSAQTPRLSLNQDLARGSYISSDTIAKARKLLYFTREECNYEGNDLPVDSVLGRILRMQRLCGSNTESVYNIYLNYAKFLNNDLVYADLKILRDTHGETIYCCPMSNHTDATKIQIDNFDTESIRPQTAKKNIAFSQKGHQNDFNGNKTAKCMHSEWSVQNNEIIENTNATPNLSAANGHRNDSKFTEKSFCEWENNTEKAGALISIENLMALRNYLLFTTARDCSILMAFHELKPSMMAAAPQDYAIKVSENVHFLTNVGVSDVDPKNVYCIQKHMQRDIEILESAISVLEEEFATGNSTL